MQIIQVIKAHESLEHPEAVRDEAKKASQRFLQNMAARPVTPVAALPYSKPSDAVEG
jgi:hypothetical protein